MFDYIFSSNQIFVAHFVGGFFGCLLSIITKNYYKSDRTKTLNSRSQKIVKAVLWSIIAALITCFLFSIDKNESFVGAFIWTFVEGVIFGSALLV